DQGFAVDENTDLTNPLAIPFNTRTEVRDFALQKFEEAYTEAGGPNAWSTEAVWMGLGSGKSYTNTQIRQVIRTMEAELIAMWPRNSTENAAADWPRVANVASEGISSGTPFNWEYYIDVSARECGTLDCVKVWGNSIGTMRVDTRVAAMITTNHQHPWPEPGGNPCPTTSPDLRVGDGSFGPWAVGAEDNAFATQPATANAGTDFACSGVPIFPAARGQYHQSNLQHVRYQHLAYRGENLPGFDGTGQDPFYTTQMNDLLWAEGIIRSNYAAGAGTKAEAVQLINNSRVGRGGLTALTTANTDAELLTALQYEQEIEFMGQGSTPFFNRRRIDGLIASTPRHMPVPAKELDVLVREVYTFGGPGGPDMAPSMGEGGTRIRSVGEIWEDYMALRRSLTARKY
ncbi:MAG: hypothetical protein ACREMJ_03550, partial [Gemmatimonadales bacterium]